MRKPFLRTIGAAAIAIPTFLVAQGGLQPRQLPKLEPRLPELQPGRQIQDPFGSKAGPLYPDRLRKAAPLIPGEQVELALPSSMQLDQAKLHIESVATQEVWELPIESLPRVLKTPSKYAVQNIRVPVAVGKTGFTTPQLPKGSYRAYYVQGSAVGPKTTIQIAPKLIASGRSRIVIDCEGYTYISLAGPAHAPATVRVRATPPRNPSGGRLAQRDILMNLRRPPSIVRLTVTAADFTNLGIQTSPQVRMDESGRAVFRFVGRQAGPATARFTAPNVDAGNFRLQIAPRPVQTVIEEPNRRLRILVFGDSIAWGQGLKPQNKYSGKVEAWMESQTSRLADTLTYAHSGGTLREMDSVNGSRRLPGELPVWFPAVPRQIEFAVDDLDGKTVDLVLVTGGINDIPVFDIINPFADTKDAVAAVAQGLEPTIKQVLVDLGRTFEFRKSLIVYTGYYPLITSESNLELMASSLFLLFSLIPSLEGRIVGLVAASVLEGILIARHGALNQQSAAFYTELTDSIQKGVAAANTELGGGARVLFVDPGFTSRNVFCADNTLLWTFGIEDEVAGQRQLDGAPHALEAPAYPVASMCHPNLEGSQRYADRIIAQIGTDARRAIWDNTKPRKPMTVETVNPNFVIPAGQTTRDFTFTVRARDASTGAPLAGDVYIAGAWAGKTGQPITRRFRRPTAATPKPEIIVARPGYVDGGLNYSIR